MTTITIERTILDRLIEAWDSTVLPTHRDGMMQERMEDLRAELAKPVERVEPITLDQFRAIANRTATTYRHRSDPEKSSYAFVDGSSLDDFWRKVCEGEAIQPTPAWHDAPTCAGLWVSDYGRFEVEHVNQADVNNFDVVYNINGRWYGPIPQDKKGGAA